MRRRLLSACLLYPLLLSVGVPTPALATTLAGVAYPPQVTVAGQPLLLNGAGIRYRFVIQVYTAGLYLPAKATTPEQVMAMAGPKRLHIVMLRDIDGNTLGKLFTRGMQDNSTRAEFGKAIPGTLRLAEMFVAKKRLTEGENFSVEWVPGRGTVVYVNGEAQGAPIVEPEFFRAMMRIWLGDKPAEEALKQALLGQQPAAASTQGN